MTPMRIQLSRAKGWRLPLNSVKVSRPGPWGNPFIAGQPSGVFPVGMGAHGKAEILIPALTLEQAIEFYRDLVHGYVCPEMYPHGHDWMQRFKKRFTGMHPANAATSYLGGKHLACWCRLCAAHAAGRPLGVTCAACAPCHVDPLLEIANPRYGMAA